MDEGSESLIRRVRDAQALAALVGQATSFRKAIGQLPAAARAKIRFIHLNQSNPALRDPSLVKRNGFAAAIETVLRLA